MMSKYGGKVPAGEDEYNKDVHHRNNRRASNQATMNNMGMERGRMRKEPDNQSSGKATAKINSKTAAAASTFRRGDEDHYDSDSDTEHHFTYLAQDGLEDRIMRLNARSPMLVHGVQPMPRSTVTISSRPA